MVKKVYLLATVLLMNVLQSCKDDIEECDYGDSVNRKHVEGINLRPLFSEHHVIPISEASEIAIKATELFADECTRTNNFNPKVIESVGIYGRTNSSLRSVSTNEDSLIYVFNFADNRGFAIVAADDRIPTQILAYIDDGSLENEVDNPGLQYALELMQDYVESSIDNFEMTKDSLLAVADKNSFIVDAKTSETRAVYTGTSYHLFFESTIGPLLKVTWDQTYPYNKYVQKECPYTTSYNGKASVGCVATATAQIMSYWQYPSIVNNHVMHWDKMCSSKIPSSSDQSEDIAILMEKIGYEVDMEYDCAESGALSSDAYEFLGNIGYKKYFSKKFNSSDADDAIRYHRPILLAGCRTKITQKVLWWNKNPVCKNCHAWVIDGCKIFYYEQENYRINTSTGEYTSTSSIVTENYFHNNWGWGGDGNGYFAAGCFNLLTPLSYDKEDYSEQRDYRYKNEMYCVYR